VSAATFPESPPLDAATVTVSNAFPVSRAQYLVLQTLVGIVLGYQLWFGVEPIAIQSLSGLILFSLGVMLSALILVPKTILQATWFNATLVGLDTAFVTATIYLSGNARSELYLSYFILMLIAASLRRLTHIIGFSLVLCAGYGFVLYGGIIHTGTLSVGHLLGAPVMLVMAVLYGMALETIGVERQQKTLLLGSIDSLRKTERALQASHDDLQARMKGLKNDLSRANEHVQQEKTEREGLERQLQDIQKMEALGRIAGRIANEFSHLLSVIGKQTGVVLSRLKPDDPLYAPVDEIFRTGEQASALTAQLATLGIQEGQVRQVLSLKTVLAESHGVIKGLLSDGIDLQIAVEDALLLVEVDREGLEQVLFQLAVNARDAMPNGGRLQIEAKRVPGGSEPTQVTGLQQQKPKVLIQVRDTGSGMNRDTQSRIFEPFFSTKETNVGLGLTAVYGIVKQSAGHVEVASQPGQGTVVRVYLPLAVQARYMEQPLSNALIAKGNETVLLVEPNEIGRKLALSILLRHRYQVLEAGSPVEALLLAQQHTGPVHLAVSDLVMPEISGRDLARRLIKQYPRMKALFVSGYDDEAILSHRINRQYLLRRPYRQAGLVEKVRELLDA
jgi:two-component system, cell cycle sensor histidine kinase and response regulator CckA